MNGFLKREFLLSLRRLPEVFNLLAFYFLIIMIFGISLNGSEYLAAIITPLVWCAALLTISQFTSFFYAGDFRRGTLEQIHLRTDRFNSYIFAKIICIYVIILACFGSAGIISVFFLTGKTSVPFSYVLGFLNVTFLVSLASAVTVAIKRSAIVATILLVPFYIPVIIFSLSTENNLLAGLGGLAGLSLIYIPCCLIGTKLALRKAISDA